MRIGITGTRTYENKRQIKEFLYKLKLNNPDVVIVGLGDKSGGDQYVKKYALELGFAYQECNPDYTSKNLYSILSESHYGKSYTPRSIYTRDKIFSSYVDKCVVFDNSNMSDIKIVNLVKMFTKKKKPLILLP